MNQTMIFIHGGRGGRRSRKGKKEYMRKSFKEGEKENKG